MDQICLNHLGTIVRNFRVVNMLRLSWLPKRIREGPIILLDQVMSFLLLLLRLWWLLLLSRLSLRRLIDNLL